jgi:hypothetical protein
MSDESADLVRCRENGETIRHSSDQVYLGH